MSATIAPPSVAAPADETFTIPGLSWDQYVAINDALGDQPNLRTLYFDGSLTFVSPARKHEWSEDQIDSILKVIAHGCRIEIAVIGSTTLRKAGAAVGLEGDRAYYIKDHAALMRGPGEIDLAIHPPPDLAIEVENTHQATAAMAIYAHLGVPEVWRCDVCREKLSFWALGPGGAYLSITHSLAFPFLEPKDVMLQVKLAEEIPSWLLWSDQLAEWVRDVIRPRLDPA